MKTAAARASVCRKPREVRCCRRERHFVHLAAAAAAAGALAVTLFARLPAACSVCGRLLACTCTRTGVLMQQTNSQNYYDSLQVVCVCVCARAHAPQQQHFGMRRARLQRMAKKLSSSSLRSNERAGGRAPVALIGLDPARQGDSRHWCVTRLAQACACSCAAAAELSAHSRGDFSTFGGEGGGVGGNVLQCARVWHNFFCQMDILAKNTSLRLVGASCALSVCKLSACAHFGQVRLRIFAHVRSSLRTKLPN